MAFRLAVAADLVDVRSCVNAAYSRHLPRMDSTPAPMSADYASLIDRGHVHLLEEQGALIGVLVAFEHVDDFFVENVAVRPERQGEGHGRALLDHAATLARRAGRERMRLYTNVAMTENLAMYPALGWQETHRVREDGFGRVYFEKMVT